MLTRRAFVTESAALLAATALPARAMAQAKYPTKAVEVVVPFSPGGGTDNLMRTIVGIIDENKWSPAPINVVPPSWRRRSRDAWPGTIAT
jgi:tripartite-type tricarboxylate transporter receptor subunit TctC